MDDALRRSKLAKLIEIEGYDSIDELMEPLMSSGTAGRWSGSAGLLDDPNQQVSQRYQILEGHHNAGAHYGFRTVCSVSKHRGGIWSYMRKSKRCEVATAGNVELPIAENFSNIIRIYYRRMLRLIGHDSLPQL